MNQQLSDIELQILQTIKDQQANLEQTLVRWSHCNSGSHHQAGLLEMSQLLEEAFCCFDTKIERIALPTAPLLRLRKHPTAPIQILLGGHYDTVFDSSHPFQTTTRLTESRLQGPGVADMKGGLLVLLTALKALEQSPWSGEVGWQILLNPDEEIGSVRSRPYWIEAAKEVQLALLFEPSLPDGSLVSTRKGSWTWRTHSQGLRAHAGRAIESGRNAIVPLLKFLLEIQQLHNSKSETSVNIGQIQGGEAPNVVPDSAWARVNIRVPSIQQMQKIQSEVKELIEKQLHQQAELKLHEESYRPPKEWSSSLEALFQAFAACGHLLNTSLSMHPSGGVCDGNFIAAAGVPVIDTLGVIGGQLHTDQEYVELESLVSRSTLTALFLLRLACYKEKFLPFLNSYPSTQGIS